MTREEIINVLQDDKMMPFIQPDQLAKIVDFVSENYKPSLPDGLEEAAKEYEFSCYKRACFHPEHKWPSTTKDAFIAGAEWQKVQDQKTIELAEDHAMLAGMNKMEQQMMEKAVECVVENWNHEPHPEITIPLNPEVFGVGDKVRVIVIKED